MTRRLISRPTALALTMTLTLTACASSDPGTRDAPAVRDGEKRAIYSGEIESDPAVQRAWEQGLSALEARCRATGEYCAAAAALRRGMAAGRPS